MKFDAVRICMLLATLCLASNANSQTVESVTSGAWTDPAIWSGGVIPTSTNATHVYVNHEVIIPGGAVIVVYGLVVIGKLTLQPEAILNILEDDLPNAPDLQVSGTLECLDLSLISGTSSSNAIFEDGSIYIHRQGPLGFIPFATWNQNATFQISGFTSSGYINIAHSDSWKQRFGNVIYDCPMQSVFVVDLNGYLRNIAGNFIIRNTNNKTLRLSTTQNPIINVGGDMIVEGPSEFWLSTNPSGCVVNVMGNFSYQSSSGGPSYLTTRGKLDLNVGGDLLLNSAGPIRMTSSVADSVGVRQATISLYGHLTVNNGSFIGPPPGNGTSRFVFRGPDKQLVATSTAGSCFLGNMEYFIDAGADVSLGTSVLSSDLGELTVHGRLSLGSTDPDGAIQLAGTGNVRIRGPILFVDGSTIEYNGVSDQFVGDGHPQRGRVNVAFNNPSTITMPGDVGIGGDMHLLQGTLNSNGGFPAVHGNVQLNSGTHLRSGFSLVGNKDQEVYGGDLTIGELMINKTGGSKVKMMGPLSITNTLKILSRDTRLISDGHLTLLSLDDAPDSSCTVAPLPPGSSIEGDVTVQRFMGGEGRIYRYISSPVADASVASLMDDIHVTGSFATLVQVQGSYLLHRHCLSMMNRLVGWPRVGKHILYQVWHRIILWFRGGDTRPSYEMGTHLQYLTLPDA